MFAWLWRIFCPNIEDLRKVVAPAIRDLSILMTDDCKNWKKNSSIDHNYTHANGIRIRWYANWNDIIMLSIEHPKYPDLTNAEVKLLQLSAREMMHKFPYSQIELLINGDIDKEINRIETRLGIKE
jgi:hypothetical protein